MPGIFVVTKIYKLPVGYKVDIHQASYYGYPYNIIYQEAWAGSVWGLTRNSTMRRADKFMSRRQRKPTDIKTVAPMITAGLLTVLGICVTISIALLR